MNLTTFSSGGRQYNVPTEVYVRVVIPLSIHLPIQNQKHYNKYCFFACLNTIVKYSSFEQRSPEARIIQAQLNTEINNEIRLIFTPRVLQNKE